MLPHYAPAWGYFPSPQQHFMYQQQQQQQQQQFFPAYALQQQQAHQHHHLQVQHQLEAEAQQQQMALHFSRQSDSRQLQQRRLLEEQRYEQEQQAAQRRRRLQEEALLRKQEEDKRLVEKEKNLKDHLFASFYNNNEETQQRQKEPSFHSQQKRGGGLLKKESEDPESVVEACSALLRVDPSRVDVLAARARALTLLKRPELALNDVFRALATSKKQGPIYATMGLAFFQQAKYADSFGAFQRSLALGGEDEAFLKFHLERAQQMEVATILLHFTPEQDHLSVTSDSTPTSVHHTDRADALALKKRPLGSRDKGGDGKKITKKKVRFQDNNNRPHSS